MAKKITQQEVVRRLRKTDIAFHFIDSRLIIQSKKGDRGYQEPISYDPLMYDQLGLRRLIHSMGGK